VNAGFERLEDVVLDDLFPEVDLALRRGRHVGREDGPMYGFLNDAHDHLEPFYRRFGAELVHKSDGYFYLLPSSDRLGRSHLSAGEMLVGQAMALLYLDPDSLLHGGVVSRELVLQRLASLVGQEDLVRVLHPRLRKVDERVAAETVRTRFGRALRALADLGFVDLVGDDGCACGPPSCASPNRCARRAIRRRPWRSSSPAENSSCRRRGRCTARRARGGRGRMSRVHAEALALVNWRGVFYERFELDRHVTGLEGDNGAGKTTVMIAAYVVLLPDMTRLRFTNLGETGATGGDKGIWGRLGESGRPSYAVLDFRHPRGERLLAGVHLERKGEPTVEPTPFIVTGLARDVRCRTSCC
jgi:chromosome partition protein MukE